MKRAYLMCLVLLATPIAEAAVGQDVRREPIIDVHMHAFPARLNPDGTPEPILCVNDRVPCDNPRSAYTTDDAVLEGVLRMMDEYNIVLGVLSSGRRQQAWLQVAPKKFLVGFTPNFGTGIPDPDSLRVLFKTGTVDVIGEVGPPYSGRAPSDSLYARYFAVAEDLEIPILIHVAGIGARVPPYRVEMGRPLLLEPVLRSHPNLRLYVENAGYPFGDEMIAILYMYPNVYVDVSTITWLIPREAFHDYLERLVRAGFGDRIMFGTDEMGFVDTTPMAIEAIESAAFLTQEQKRDIFFHNAVRFFRLDAEALLARTGQR